MSPSAEHFGAILRRGREARGLSLAELSRATKIKETALAALEAAALDELPAPVFVRGFVEAYARAVGLDAAVALAALGERLAPVVPSEVPPAAVELVPDEHEPDGRSRMGVALLVLLILVVATLTLSLLLRHPTRPGGPISSITAGTEALDRT